MPVDGEETTEEGVEEDGLGREGCWEGTVSIDDKDRETVLSWRWLGGRGAAARVEGERPAGKPSRTRNI